MVGCDIHICKYNSDAFLNIKSFSLINDFYKISVSQVTFFDIFLVITVNDFIFATN